MDSWMEMGRGSFRIVSVRHGFIQWCCFLAEQILIEHLYNSRQNSVFRILQTFGVQMSFKVGSEKTLHFFFVCFVSKVKGRLILFRYIAYVCLCLCAWKKKIQEDTAFIFYLNISQLNFSLHHLSLDFYINFLDKKWCTGEKNSAVISWISSNACFFSLRII